MLKETIRVQRYKLKKQLYFVGIIKIEEHFGREKFTFSVKRRFYSIQCKKKIFGALRT